MANVKFFSPFSYCVLLNGCFLIALLFWRFWSPSSISYLSCRRLTISSVEQGFSSLIQEQSASPWKLLKMQVLGPHFSYWIRNSEALCFLKSTCWLECPLILGTTGLCLKAHFAASLHEFLPPNPCWHTTKLLYTWQGENVDFLLGF